MSSRPASPPPITRWPFYASAGVLICVAIYLLITAGRPPAVPALIISMFCLGGSIVVCVIPTALENERRLRLAEAAVRDAADAQLRRLAQTADQLTHVVSRSQSTEEQAGQALGTLEEVAERMVAQAEELAAALTRSGEREQAAQSGEIQRLNEERDQKLTALEIRLNALSVALTEAQGSIKKSSTTTTRAIESLATRLEDIADELRTALAARPAGSTLTPAARTLAEHTDADTPGGKSFEAEHPTAEVEHQASAPAPAEVSVAQPASAEPAPAAPEANEAPALTAAAEMPDEETPVPAHPTADVPVDPAPVLPRPPRKPRAHRVAEKHEDEPRAVDAPVATNGASTAEEPAPGQPAAPLELALEGMPEPRPMMRLNRREPPGSTSLVATAYIGIGNKLYLRGDGPGLSWDRGVPMQFLAIGKWGWTTTEAAVPVTCRVYRNDDTPMLEENIVIDPGTKSEITPKF